MSSIIMNPASSQPSRNGRVSFGPQSSTHSLLLERAKANVNRRPTPDSEVMVSSDDEHPNGGQSSLRRASTSRPTSSWLSDVGQPQPARKYSTGGLSMGSAGSQPPTPSTEGTPRLSSQVQGRPGASVSFGHNIWAADRSKDYNRFDNAPHSPLSLTPLHSEPAPLASRDRRYSGIGVDIPLNPTFKPQQQRAMSFSVAPQGSHDDDEMASPLQGLSRVRSGLQASNVTRKASLSRVREDEDDGVGLRLGSEYDSNNSQNLLRRAIRHRTLSTNVPGYLDGTWANSPRRSSTLPFADDAIEEVDAFAVPESRRHSLAHIVTGPHGHSSLQSRPFTDHGQQTPDNNPSLLSTPLSSISRTEDTSSAYSGYFSFRNRQDLERKASLADPLSYTEHINAMAPRINDTIQDMDIYRHLPKLDGIEPELHPIFPVARQTSRDPNKPVQQTNPDQYLGTDALPKLSALREIVTKQHAANYFSGQSALPNMQHSPGARSEDGSRNVRKILHLVKFKCERAEVYYVPENSGLNLSKGQLVIVDGDRGFDIGEIEKANIDSSEVKTLRQIYQEKHFIWLMMFSRARETNPTVRWALSNLDPHNASARHPDNDNDQEGRSSSFKLIKRIAVPVEFASLQEKEGDETKAKRMCQQKVIEHGLDMEILDAEFQLDRHKLTYYYYAEKYINFNELVNDLFKIFKTRIWMSAVNPASFAPQGSRTHHSPGFGPSLQQSGTPQAVNQAPQGPGNHGNGRTQPQAASYNNYSAFGAASGGPSTSQPRHDAFTATYGSQFSGVSATPAPYYSSANTHTAFNPYAQPYVSNTWGAPSTFGASDPWGPSNGLGSTSFAPPSSSLGMSSTTFGTPSYGLGATTSGPGARAALTSSSGGAYRGYDQSNLAVQPPRKRSSTEKARDEAAKAAFFSAVDNVAKDMRGLNVEGTEQDGKIKN